jgi:hypothetical protein
MKPLSNKNEPAPELTPSSMRKMTAKSQSSYPPQLVHNSRISNLSKKFQPSSNTNIANPQRSKEEEKNTTSTTSNTEID